MRIKSVPVPTEATSLATLLEKLPRHTGAVGIQAPEANTGTVFVGDRNEQPLEIRPRASGLLRTAAFNELYIRGTEGDFLTVVLMDGA